MNHFETPAENGYNMMPATTTEFNYDRHYTLTVDSAGYRAERNWQSCLYDRHTCQVSRIFQETAVF